jgi:hypothetical protein
MLSFPPLPVVPSNGELSNLANALKFAQKQQFSAWDSQPIPFAVVGTNLTSGQVNTVKNNPNSNSQMRVDIDVDSNPNTGKGGKDLSVGVSTELFLNGVLNPHLVATYDRLGSAPFATNFEVLVSFPFGAFAPEFFGATPTIQDPNLFIGYKTTGLASPTTPGGSAPLKEVIRFVPNIMAAATHPNVDITLDTTGDVNPLQFLTGYFTAAPASGLAGIKDAAAYAAWVQQPPDHIGLNANVSSNALFAGTGIDGKITLTWTASNQNAAVSARSKVVLDYLEDENANNLNDPDYDTKITFDTMPTSEQISLNINEAAKTLKLSHRANATTGSIQVLSERNDGLTITGTASQVPTAVDLTINLDGSATIDVTPIGAGTTDNNLDLKLEAKKTGGFLDTDQFLGYDLGYAAVEMTDVSDAFIGFDPATDSVGAHTIVPTESIGAIALIIGDDDNLELPPAQTDLGGGTPWADPNRHVFSLIDDGTHGTAAARLVHLQDATLHLDATDVADIFTLKFSQAAPLTAYLRTTPTSNLINGHDIEVTLNINNIPAGQSSFNMSFPNDFEYDLPTGAEINSIHAFGHIDCMFFDVLLQDLPNKFHFTFDPNGAATLLAQDSVGNPDRVGVVAVRLWHEEIPDFVCPDDSLLPDSPLPDLLGDKLQEARLRLDDIPSFHATWSDNPNTSISFDTDASSGAFQYLGGAQVAVSTAVDLPALQAVNTPALVAAAQHYLVFRDQGANQPKQLKAGAFGIDKFSYNSNDTAGTYALSYRSNGPHVLTATFDSAFGGRYFPQFDTLLNLTVTSVPTSFDFFADVDPGFRYAANAPISSITVTGNLDLTDNNADDGTSINFKFDTLPAVVRFSLDAGELKVFDGKLDVNADNAGNNADDGIAGGITVIDGKLDTNFDGVISSADDDTFLGAAVIDGGLDTNLDGTVDGNDDGSLAGLELKMSGQVNAIDLVVSSPTAIFGAPFQLAEAHIDTVPAHTLATWAGKKILVETTDANGAAQPLGQISALLSTDRAANAIDSKLEPFTQGEGGARIHYSPYLQEIDTRYLNAGGSGSVTPRLDELYNQAQVLNNGEDHVVARVVGGALDIASLQFSGFQKLLVDPEKDGGTYEFRKPVAGVSPFFVGAGINDTFAMIQIDNIPDLVRLVTNTPANDITFHVEDDAPPPAGSVSHIGDVDIYIGPAPTAADGDAAARVIMKDVPDDVHIFWGFGFPSGSVNFDASDEFQLLFLAQDGGTRLAGALQLEDLQLGYDVGIDVHFDVDWFGPVPTSLNLNILTATAGIDNDVDDSSIAANPDKPGVDGFFSLYSMTGSPSNPQPAGPAHASSEYVPSVSFLMKDFREFSLTLEAGIEIIPAFLSPNLDLTTNLVGDFVFDFWAGEVNLATNFDGDDAPEFGFLNIKDYIDNTPIHLVPGDELIFANPIPGSDFVFTFVGLHRFDDHFDPFA